MKFLHSSKFIGLPEFWFYVLFSAIITIILFLLYKLIRANTRNKAILAKLQSNIDKYNALKCSVDVIPAMRAEKISLEEKLRLIEQSYTKSLNQQQIYETRIQEYDIEIEKIRTVLKETRTQLSDSDNRLQEIEQQKNVLELSYNQVQAQLSLEIESGNSLKKEILQLKGEFAQKTKAEEQLKEELSTIEQTVKEKTAIIEKQSNEIVEYNNKNQKLVSQNQQVTNQVEDLSKSNSEQATQINCLLDQLAHLVTEKEQYIQNITNLESAIDELKNNNAKKQEQIDQKIEELSVLKQELDSISPYLSVIEEYKAKIEKEALDCKKKQLGEEIENAVAVRETYKHFQPRNIIDGVIQSIRTQIDETPIAHFQQLFDQLHKALNDANITEKEQDSIDSQILTEKNELKNVIERANEFKNKCISKEVESELKNAIVVATSILKIDNVALEQVLESKNRLGQVLADAKDKEENFLQELKEIENLRAQLSSELQRCKTVLESISHEEIRNSLNKAISKVSVSIGDLDVSKKELEVVFHMLSQTIEDAIVEEKRICRNEKQKRETVRSITEIWDREKGESIYASEFFSRPSQEIITWRRFFEESITLAEHRFICPECKQDVKISGRKYSRGEVSFFSHLHDSDYCSIKTTSGLSKDQIEARKYGYVNESPRHKRLKDQIASYLRTSKSQINGISNVEVEKRITSNIPYLNFRKPDVMARYKDMNLVFELQLSTTFISVVVQRDLFYRLNNYFIIWVFNFEENSKYVDLSNLMCKDIYYANKRNIFIFDSEAQEKSQELGELVLKCNWLDTDGKWHFPANGEKMGGMLVTLSDLKYDTNKSKPYYYDADTPYLASHPVIASRLEETERKTIEIINSLQRRQEQEQEKKEQERLDALSKLREENGTVTPYEQNKKWGFKYGNYVLVQPAYSSVAEFGNRKLFKVGWNRHYGLIDQFGNTIASCEYLDFQEMDNGLILASTADCYYFVGMKKTIADRRPDDIISTKYINDNTLLVTIKKTKIADSLIYIFDNEYILFKDNHECWLWYSSTGHKVNDHVLRTHIIIENSIWGLDCMSNKWGCCDFSGRTLVEFEYDRPVFVDNNNYAITQSGDGAILVDNRGTLVFDKLYQKIELSQSNCWKVCNNSKYGLVDNENKQILPVGFDSIKLEKSGVYLLSKDNLCSLWNIGNPLPEHFIYTEILELSSTKKLFKVFIGGKCGVIDDLCNHIIPCKYEEISIIADVESELFFRAENEHGIGVIDRSDNVIIPFEFSAISYLFNQDVFIVGKQDNYGLFKIGKGLITELKYTSQIFLEEKTRIRVVLSDTREIGHLDLNGKEIISEEKKSEDGYIFKKFFSKWSVWNPSGIQVIYNLSVDDIQFFEKDKFLVRNSRQYGLVSSSGDVLIPIKYDNIIRQENSPFYILEFTKFERIKESMWGYYGRYEKWVDKPQKKFLLVDNNGSQTSIPDFLHASTDNMSFIIDSFIKYNDKLLNLDSFKLSDFPVISISGLGNGYYKIENGANCNGIIDKDFNILVPFEFSEVYRIEGVWVAEKNMSNYYNSETLYFLYNENGLINMDSPYTLFEPQGDGTAIVQYRGRRGKVDSSGNVLIGEPILVVDNLFKKNRLGKWALFDKNGDSLSLFIYDDIQLLNDNLIRIKTNSKEGCLNTKLNKVIECKYESITCKDSVIITAYADGQFELFDKFGNKNIDGLFAKIEKGNTDHLILGYYTNNRINVHFCVRRIDGSYVIHDDAYNSITWDGQDYAATRAGETGYFDSEGSPKVKEITQLTETLSIGRFFMWGLIFESNLNNVQFVYKSIRLVNDSYLILEDSTGFFLADLAGNRIFKNCYSHLSYCEKCNLFIAGNKKYIYASPIYGIISFDESVIVDFDYNSIRYEDNDYFIVKKGLYDGVINCQGKPVIGCNKFTQISWETDRFRCIVGNLSGYYSAEGKIIPEMRPISESLIVASHLGKRALMNSEGKKLTPFIYDSITFKGENRIVVTQKEAYKTKCGMINNSGDFIIPYTMNFSLIEVLDSGNISVTINNRVYKYELNANDEGNLVPNKKELDLYCDCLELNGMYALCNKKGELLSQYDYSEISSFSERKYFACRGKKWGILNNNGNMLLEFKYCSIEKISDSVASVSWFASDKRIGHGYRGNPYTYYDTVKKTKQISVGDDEIKTNFVIGNEYVGTIVAKKAFGVFIRIEGIGDGLLHKSEILKARKSISNIEYRTSIKVRVTNIRKDDLKPNFSIVQYPIPKKEEI